MAIMAAMAELWIMPSGTSKLMAESTRRPVTRILLDTTHVDLNKEMLGPP